MNSLFKKSLAIILFSVLLLGVENIQANGEDKEGNLNWIENVENAKKLAKDKGLPVLVNFTGSDWCIWCKRLEGQIFSKKDFINYANKNFVLLKIDFPRNIEQTKELKAQNESIAKEFKIQGFPTIVLLNKDFKEVGRTGYQKMTPKEYVEHLKSFYK